MKKPTTEYIETDFTFVWEGRLLNVECKQPQSKKQLRKRMSAAQHQINRSGRCGVIAIDCSALYRPSGTVLETSEPEAVEFEMYEWLRTNIRPEIRLLPKVLGLLLFSRVPAMTALDLVDHRGNSIVRRDCISSWLAVGNADSTDQATLRNVASMLRNQARSALANA